MLAIDFKHMIVVAVMILVAVIITVIIKSYSKSIKLDIKSGLSDIEVIDEAIYENQPHIKKRRKIIGTIKSIGFYGLTFLIIPFFIFSIINKFQRNLTMINDTGIVVVATGSMSYKHEANDYLDKYSLDNQFNAYDIIVVSNVKSDEDVNVHDVIAFLNDERKIIIHRVVEKTEINGQIIYTTRGDANGEDDLFKSTISDIKGKYENIRIPLIGSFIIFFQSYVGIITIVLLIYSIILFDKELDKIDKEKNLRLKLFDYIDFENMHLKEGDIRKIHYRKVIYQFNHKGFVGKFQNESGLYSNEPINKLIVETTNGTDEPKVEQYLIGKDEE